MQTDCLPGSAHRYLALDALRGAAAFAVLFHHLGSTDAPGHITSGRIVFASGYLAVDTFFLLSGFVLSHAYCERLQRALSFRQFMIARFVRLQPAISVGTLIGFALALSQRLLDSQGAPGFFEIATSLPANLFMMPNVLLPWGIFLFNPPAWSLFYELLANAGYALAIKKLAARCRGTGAIDLALASICFAGFAGLIATLAIAGNLDKGVILDDAPFALARIVFSFTLGVLMHRKRRIWMPLIPRLPIPWLLAVCMALLALDFGEFSRSLYDFTFATIISPGLVMLAAVAEPSPGFAATAVWLGAISYPLYAVHAPIKHVIAAILPLPVMPLMIVSTVTALLVAWLVGTTIDAPLRRWLGRRLHVRSTDTAPAMPRALLP
jgi:peptidoglycan/LPS O-acetylase OafA/YrhL